ncbi:HAD hydrolase, IA, variant 1 family protein [Neorickettsia helminthoeca str. Oregon]|uniref:phosphoglycolate phosphatase n=1 Tax=Neorickettsia helminthoeca str. Oregon TaxID=1286528 RepID=X5HMT8_9RICK|nr:HAD hydrolase, IA, variant 1 family protein [Neorickettsia helminthoeca str. Oregon]
MVLNALNKALKQLNKPIVEDYINTAGRAEFFKQSFGGDWEYANEVFNNYLRHESIQSIQDIRIFPGFVELLDYINENGIFTGIVSNKSGELLRKEIEALGLTNNFDVAVGSGDTDQDKPSAKPLLYALSGSGISPSENDVTFIGDSIIDMECAKNASVRGVIYGSPGICSYDNIPVIYHYGHAKSILF